MSRTISSLCLQFAATTLFSLVLFTHQTSAATRTTGVGFEGIQSTVAIGFGIPHATAVDAAGNVFVTDASTHSLYKISAVGAQTTIASGLAAPSGVALASDGTAFVAVSGAIVRVAPPGAVSNFATGPSEPGGIVLNSTGNLYLADPTGNRILEFAPNGAETTFVSGLNAPESIALDGAGNLYIADTGNNRILSVPSTGTSFVCPADCTVLSIQTSDPSGIVSDVNGNLYIADTGHGQIVKLAQDADFHTAPVVASNVSPVTSLTLNYLLYGSSCASLPTLAVLTRGATGKDFTYDPTANVCTPGTPDALAVTVNFSPLSPGLRTGSVQFIDQTGVPQIATYLHGVGKGAQITWTPGVVAPVLTTPGTQ